MTQKERGLGADMTFAAIAMKVGGARMPLPHQQVLEDSILAVLHLKKIGVGCVHAKACETVIWKGLRACSCTRSRDKAP